MKGINSKGAFLSSKLFKQFMKTSPKKAVHHTANLFLFFLFLFGYYVEFNFQNERKHLTHVLKKYWQRNYGMRNRQ